MTDRRTFLARGCAAAGAAGAGALGAPASAAAPVPVPAGTGARNYVLVHGAWHGGWCWQRVAARLRAAGHAVYAPSLTGLADRAHLLAPTITLETHAQDVARLVEWEELDRVVLVGHSYGGTVISAACERVGPRLAHLVYLDAVVLKDGQSWSSYNTPEQRQQRAAQASSHPGRAWAVPKAAVFGIADPADQAWVDRRLTPHPHGPYEGTVRLAENYARVPKTYIDCSKPAFAALNVYKQAVRNDPAWRYLELPTGHDAMVTAPGPLAELLLGLG